MAERTRDSFEGIDFVVEYEPRGTAIRFRAFEVLYDHAGEPFFEHLNGCGADGRETPDTAAARPVLTGSVRFDGAIHLYVGEDGYLHLPHPAHMERIARLVQRIHEFGGRMLGTPTAFRSAY